MNKLFISRMVISVLSVMTVFSFAACVNEEYDLSKGLDMEVNLLPNTAIPLGNVAPISINSLLGDAGASSSAFSVDDNGNLSLSFGHDRLVQSFTMPEVEIGGEGGIRFDDNVEVRFIPKYKGINLGGMSVSSVQNIKDIPDEVHFSDSEGGNLEREFELSLEKELPEQILDIDVVHMQSSLFYHFNVSRGSILHIKEGFSMEFPDFMVIEKAEDADNYVIDSDNPHKIVFVEDTKLTYSDPLILEVSFVRMDIPAGAIVTKMDPVTRKESRYISIPDAVVDVTGDLYLKVSDYVGSTIPECPVLTMDIELENLKMTSAHVKLDMDIDIADKKIAIGELPDIFAGEGTVVDLYNPILKFLLDNGSPLDMYLNANITSYSGTHQSDIHIGDCTPIHGDSHSDHATAPVSIAANSEAEYYFSRRGHHDTSNGTDIELEHIGDMIRELPDSIVIHDISVETDDSFVNVVANQNCNVEMEYEFFCPLAFGKDLNISFDYDIDLGFDGESVGIDSLVISMNMVNTIPLDFAITGVALDADGNEIRNASVDLDLDLAAGTLDAPVESPAEVVISTSGLASVEKLRLKLTATSSRAMEGKILNTAQGLGINDLHVTLPNGINLDLSSDENEIFE